MDVILYDIIETLETNIPLAYQEDYDNCGLQVGDVSQEITSVLISLDITLKVIDEAIKNNCNLIISHHPLIFSPLKKILTNDNSKAFSVNKLVIRGESIRLMKRYSQDSKKSIYIDLLNCPVTKNKLAHN